MNEMKELLRNEEPIVHLKELLNRDADHSP